MSTPADIRFRQVAVLMGGPGAEREVSLETGSAVAGALARRGVNVTAIDWQGDLIAALQAQAFDAAFIALHGRGGEDGQVQGLLEFLGIPYTGSNLASSALAMDKARTKWLWQAQGLSTPQFQLATAPPDVAQVLQQLQLPLVVKPASEGSSVGASIVRDPEQLKAAWEQAQQYDRQVLLEQYVDGAEYTCSILDGQALPVIRLETDRVFYDYQAKYVDDDTRYLCPCGLGHENEKEIQALALSAFELLGCSGWGRVDLIIDKLGQAQLLEANTVPGMTSHSLVPMAAAAVDIDFDELCVRILNTARLHGSASRQVAS